MKEQKHENKNAKAIAGAIILFAGRPDVANAGVGSYFDSDRFINSVRLTR